MQKSQKFDSFFLSLVICDHINIEGCVKDRDYLQRKGSAYAPPYSGSLSLPSGRVISDKVPALEVESLIYNGEIQVKSMRRYGFGPNSIISTMFEEILDSIKSGISLASIKKDTLSSLKMDASAAGLVLKAGINSRDFKSYLNLLIDKDVVATIEVGMYSGDIVIVPFVIGISKDDKSLNSSDSVIKRLKSFKDFLELKGYTTYIKI